MAPGIDFLFPWSSEVNRIPFINDNFKWYCEQIELAKQGDEKALSNIRDICAGGVLDAPPKDMIEFAVFFREMRIKFHRDSIDRN